jgi:hypothetical protein
MLKLLVIPLLFALGGCAPTHFYNTSVTQEQYNKDYYECTTQAGAESWGGNPLILDEQRAKCMKARGYTSQY